MIGDGTLEKKGLAPRMFEQIIDTLEQKRKEGICDFSLYFEIFEIYNDKVRSLIDSSSTEKVQSY